MTRDGFTTRKDGASLQQRLLKLFPSTLVTSIAGPDDPVRQFTDAKRKLLTQVPEHHRETLRVRQAGLNTDESHDGVEFTAPHERTISNGIVAVLHGPGIGKHRMTIHLSDNAVDRDL